MPGGIGGHTRQANRPTAENCDDGSRNAQVINLNKVQKLMSIKSMLRTR